MPPMKNLIVTIALVFFNIMAVSAQTRIYGVVADGKGEPLAGVNIQEKGTGNGTVSDKDGNYSKCCILAVRLLIIS